MGWGGGSEEESGDWLVARRGESKRDSSQKARWEILPHFADYVRNDRFWFLSSRSENALDDAALGADGGPVDNGGLHAGHKGDDPGNLFRSFETL